MLKIGLTGSIAVGKSFVCGVLGELGCHVLDADIMAREAVKPGTAGLKSIIEEFGQDILQTDGGLDRAKLAAIVFDNESKRQRLNSIVHPLVIAAQDEWIAMIEEKDPLGIAVIDAALMIESGSYKRFDKLIVVWCDPAIQLERLMQRGGLSEIQAQKRIDSQMSQEEKKNFADYLIDTSGSIKNTRQQTVEIFDQLRVSKG